MLIVCQSNSIPCTNLFLFDHTFRKLENDIKKRQADSNSDKLLKRIGVAMGEEDLDSDINVDSQIFMKRTGELADDFSKVDDEDQVAMESSFSFSVNEAIKIIKFSFTRLPYK